METDKFKILNNFLDDASELLNSEYSADFAPLRNAYKEELAQPGCTQCIRNACRNKYTQRIMGILNGEIDPKAPPPTANKPPQANKKVPPEPRVLPPRRESNASNQQPQPQPQPQQPQPQQPQQPQQAEGNQGINPFS